MVTEGWRLSTLIEDRRNELMSTNPEMVYELFYWPVFLLGSSLAWFIGLAAIGVAVRLCRAPRPSYELGENAKDGGIK